MVALKKTKIKHGKGQGELHDTQHDTQSKPINKNQDIIYDTTPISCGANTSRCLSDRLHLQTNMNWKALGFQPQGADTFTLEIRKRRASFPLNLQTNNKAETLAGTSTRRCIKPEPASSAAEETMNFFLFLFALN